MLVCQWCSGSRYLNDRPGLGPCVCCSPENMRALEARAARLKDALQASTDQVEWMAQARSDTAHRIIANRRRNRAREVADYNDVIADLEAAADALQAYFVRWGFPADPVTLPDPLLTALWRILEDYKP